MSTTQIGRILRTMALSLIASGLATAGTVTLAEGSVTVTSAVNQTGALYQYNFTVMDGTGLLAVLDIAVPPGANITGISAPGGLAAFQTAYDSVLGLVSFVENNGLFTASPLSGFVFSTTLPPGASSFGVTLFDGATGSGSVQGPVGPTTPGVPEPASLSLSLLGAAALLLWRKSSLTSRLQF